MPIVFSAIMPHSPLLIPSIGKTNIKKFRKTTRSFERLEHDLYASKPDSLLIISPHGPIIDNAFTLNLSEHYTADFEMFGDFATRLSFRGDTDLMQKIRAGYESSDSKNIPSFVLKSVEHLDYGCGVPLFYLLSHLKNLPIVPIYYSLLGRKASVEFGQLLQRKLHQIDQRIAVIASANLSHRLSESSPSGYSKEGIDFDKKIIEYIKSKNIDDLLEVNDDILKKVEECGFYSLLILFGLLGDLDYEVEALSYEYPFGVGCFSAVMKIS